MAIPSNDDVLTRLKAMECQDATYPARAPALIMQRGRGSYVYDVEGREYIDLCAGFGALALGHNPLAHQQVLASRMEQPGAQLAPLLTHGMGDVYASSAKVELLAYLLELMPPPLAVAAVALTGAQAVELAVKTAILATQRSRFVVFNGSYHGLDLGLLPLTDKAAFSAPFAGFCVAGKVNTAEFLCDEQQLDAELNSRQVAAVLVEPVQGRAGVRQAPLAWLAMLRRVCDRYGTLLIYDEVFTGLGRTGRLTYANEVPCDLLCLGKALGGGFPLSACVGTRAVMDAWPVSTGEAIHTGTFFGHPLSCAIALATLRQIVDDRLVERSHHLGVTALSFLQDTVAQKAGVKEVRGTGLMMAIEFHRHGMGATLMDLLRAHGVIALASGRFGEVLSITPALTIPQSVLLDACRTVAACITTAAAAP